MLKDDDKKASKLHIFLCKFNYTEIVEKVRKTLIYMTHKKIRALYFASLGDMRYQFIPKDKVRMSSL